MNTKIFISGALLASGVLLQAAGFTESTYTDIVRSVNTVSITDKSSAPAKLNDVLKAPNLVRTGASSRAELTAPDETITRIGANTVFSFAPTGREINLEQGSVLFHSPSGRGGGTIRSGGASAAVSGTTLIVTTTGVMDFSNKNGFKVILLEGTGRVTLPNKKYRVLKAGQMIFVLPGHSDFGPLLTINLMKLVTGSALINGFGHELPSLHLIQLAILAQQKALDKGLAIDTGTPADNFLIFPWWPYFGPNTKDPNLVQIGIGFPLIYPRTVGGGGDGSGPFPSGPNLPGFFPMLDNGCPEKPPCFVKSCGDGGGDKIILVKSHLAHHTDVSKHTHSKP